MTANWINPADRLPENSDYVLVHFTSKDLDDCCGKPPVVQVGLGQYELKEWWVDSRNGSFTERSDSVHGWMPIDWPEVP